MERSSERVRRGCADLRCNGVTQLTFDFKYLKFIASMT